MCRGRRPGRAQRYDYEYERKGTANIFLAVEPLRGWRRVTVTERRTKLDFAAQMQQLVDVHYPEAKKVRLVLDNLNSAPRGALSPRGLRDPPSAAAAAGRS